MDILKTFICSALIVYIIYRKFFKPPPPKPKDHKQTDKDNIVIEVLSAKTSIKAIAKRENKSVKEIEDWIESFFNDSKYFIDHKNDLNSKVGELETDIEWFKRTCKKFIGDDWEEKTEYAKRKR